MSVNLINETERVKKVYHYWGKNMKKEIALYSFFLFVFVMSCSLDKQLHKELPYIDVNKDYPEMEINLTNIADIAYLQLNTDSSDFVYKGSINYVTQNTIVVTDQSSNSVLFFSKDGSPKSRFNRMGQGPEEYMDAAYVMYDEAADDVYISPDFSNYINVYSSSGEYKRKLTLPQNNIGGQMAFLGDQSILVYDNTKKWQSTIEENSNDKITFSKQAADSSFYLISKADGTVLEYINLPRNNIDLSYSDPAGTFFAQVNYARVRKSPDGLFLFNPESDTIFLYNKDKFLTAFMHKKPLLSKLNPLIVMDICMDVGDFQFMSVYFYSMEGKSPEAKYYMQDKKTDEIFRQKFILPDYKGKDFYFNPRLQNYSEKEYHFELDVFELKEAYRENKLSGKLKELATTLNEDEDSNIFVFVDFK